MKTLIIQSASVMYREPQEKLSLKMEFYCRRHGITYLMAYGKLQEKMNPMWDRIHLILFGLQRGFELVVWIDTDSIVVKPDVDLRLAANEFTNIGAVRHKIPYVHYNCGVLFCRNTFETSTFFNRVLEVGELEHPIWKLQQSIFKVNQRMLSIDSIDDKWNSTVGVNESPDPVIKSWHGRYEQFLKDNKLTSNAIHKKTNQSVFRPSKPEIRQEKTQGNCRMQEDGETRARSLIKAVGAGQELHRSAGAS